MGRNQSAVNPRKRLIEELPPASSSEEEVEEEAEEVSSQENDAVHDADDDDSDAEINSDRSFPSPVIEDFTVKPIVSEPKISARSGEGTSLRKSERLLASPTKILNEKTGPVLFQRLWSEEDELGILRCMIEYKAKKGKDPFIDIGGFHDVVKKSVRDDVNQNQLKDKMRRLKKRYETNMRKGDSREDFSFSKPHEKKVFELAKKIWGVETKEIKKGKKKAKIASSNGQDNGGITLGLAARKNKDKNDVSQEGYGACKVAETVNVADMVADDKQQKYAEVGSNYPYLKQSLEMDQLLEMPCFLKGLLRENLERIPKRKAKELELKWMELKQDELKLYQKRIELVKEQAQVALDFIKVSDT